MKKYAFFLAALLAALLICGCTDTGNRPYEPSTPAPDAHDGTFWSDHGSLTFNGDGESVALNIDGYLAGLSGLPEGEHEGTYVFLSGDLPPVGSTPVRYDSAHELKITVDGRAVIVDLGVASADGKSATAGVGTVTPDRIPMLFSDEGGSFSIIFQKKGG